jgi:hypothetical protein
MNIKNIMTQTLKYAMNIQRLGQTSKIYYLTIIINLLNEYTNKFKSNKELFLMLRKKVKQIKLV